MLVILGMQTPAVIELAASMITFLLVRRVKVIIADSGVLMEQDGLWVKC